MRWPKSCRTTSDGHCIGSNWEKQREFCRPFFGRWDPDFNIQWQALMYLGNYWGGIETRMKTDELVSYAVDIVKGGGVITFDVGATKSSTEKPFHASIFPKLRWCSFEPSAMRYKTSPSAMAAAKRCLPWSRLCL